MRAIKVALLKHVHSWVRRFNANIATVLFACLAMIIAYCSYAVGALNSWHHQQQQAIAHVKTRIALDAQYIGLPNRLLEVPGDRKRVVHYLKQLNTHLTSQGYAIQVHAIAGTTLGNETSNLESFNLIRTGGETFTVTLSPAVMPLAQLLSPWPFLIVLLLSVAMRAWFKTLQSKLDKAREAGTPILERKRLLIDLADKSLRYGEQGRQVQLANKPLCFYLALLEFGIEYPEVTLNQNKEVPQELLDLAHKYFGRLIDLGHTIRKRPNFGNSLEKTLSEIRAALDEVFAADSQDKEPYFPPKAHGEGSRSRVHHYGLRAVDDDDFEVIGK
ncbi:hypothetical protein MHM89_05325 [Pseudoalteromonas sp. CNC9-20]|uniref:hypothetical protein n=1 Tax=Pseudoalteromonas sp. CNC9-20 TaxID=2917750 RepID=UPI001EF6C700|nr:hypothetical protein [Pseudoalteromonas sp. CNC9-20]MCG7569346.1 hypothetical protein [Pseudoalteromonas sp. CNC9-20]